jgi:hypothetical protein
LDTRSNQSVNETSIVLSVGSWLQASWIEPLSFVIRWIFSSFKSLLGFLVASAIFIFLYLLLLPMQYTSMFTLENLTFVNWWIALYSVVMGCGFGAALSSSFLGLKFSGSKASSSFSSLVGVVPSVLCCTPVIPLVLSTLGASTAGIYAVSGKIQGTLSTYESLFLIAGFLILLLSLRSIGKKAISCSVDNCCS